MINGGTLNINVAADGAKGIRCDSLMTITDDDGYHTTINITTATTAYAGERPEERYGHEYYRRYLYDYHKRQG